MLNFSGRSQLAAAKMKEIYFLVFIKEKPEFIPSSEMKCPKSGFSLILGGMSRVKQY